MISRLDKSVLRDITTLTVIGVLGLTFLFSALSLYQIVNRFEVTPNIDTLLSFAPSLWVSLLPMTLPISALFATAMVFGRMRSDRELLLLSAAGVAPWRGFAAVIPVGIIVAGISWFGVSEWGPDAYSERHNLQRKALADFIDHPPRGPRELRFPGSGDGQASVDISYKDFSSGRFENLSIIIYNNEGLLSTLTTRSARITYQRHTGTMTLARCADPRLMTFDPITGAPVGSAIVATRINELQIPFKFGSDSGPKSSKALNTTQLLNEVYLEIQRPKAKQGASAELVRRTGLAFAGLLLPLLGALLAAMINHPNRLLPIAIGVIPSAVGYYPVMTAASTLAESGTLNVYLGMAMAPLLTGITIFCLAVYQRKGRWA
ncbi:MAG: LptF/LptG family permease [Planctomycetes bacterium]|nr:LptF/LptG family permease [Planctomycetota bacterium]